MRKLCEWPRLRVWHLVGIVAVCALFISVFQFRARVYDPISWELRQARYGDAARRIQALRFLSGQAPDRAGVVEILIAATQDDDPKVRAAAVMGLSDFMLRSNGKDPRLPTAEAVLAEPSNGKDPRLPTAEAVLAERLADRDAAVRNRAAVTLSSLGRKSETVRGVLLTAARGDDPDECGQALFALGQEFPDDEEVLSLLLAGTKAPSPRLRWQSYNVLGRTFRRKRPPKVSGPVLDAFRAGLRDEDQTVRSTALSAFNGLGLDQVRPALPDLIRCLDDRDQGLRLAAIYPLAALGADAEPALPALRKLKDEQVSPRLTAAAGDAIDRITSQARSFREETLPELIGDLKNEEPERRRLAAWTIGQHGPIARDAAPALRRLRDDPDESVRRAAEATLREIEAAPLDEAQDQR